MKKRVLAIVLIVVSLLGFTSCKGDDPSSQEPRGCYTCGRIFQPGTDDWVCVEEHGKCCACYNWELECREEEQAGAEWFEEQTDMREVDFYPSFKVGVFLISDHIVQLINNDTESWTFDENFSVLYRTGSERIGYSYWYVGSNDTSTGNTEHVLEPGSSIYLYCDLTPYITTLNGDFKLVFGDMEDGSSYYSAGFWAHDGVIGYGGPHCSSPTVACERLEEVHRRFYYSLQNTDEYREADNDTRVTMVGDMLDELASDEYEWMAQPVRSRGTVVDGDSIVLVNDSNEISFYFRTVDGLETVIEIWNKDYC